MDGTGVGEYPFFGTAFHAGQQPYPTTTSTIRRVGHEAGAGRNDDSKAAPGGGQSMMETNSKVTAIHRDRKAYLYIRQSTPRQVMENCESTQRQYALQQRVQMLGWSAEQIVIIDDDLGLSGASAGNRQGFQRLVAEVSLNHAGMILGLEVSRLARNCADWYRLLEICASTRTLIMDEDGIYDPAGFNDRLVLGLKGTLSEAESYQLRARMRGGILNKARRGALEIPIL